MMGASLKTWPWGRIASRAFSVVFVLAAGSVALQMAYASAASETERMTMLTIVGAGLILLMFGPHMTLGRRQWLAALVLAPIWLAAVCYNGLSALEYFDRYLSDAEARAKLGSQLFTAARDDLVQLRETRGAIKTVRAVATIESDIGRKGISEDAASKYRRELDEARERDRIDAAIRAAAAKLATSDARGAVEGGQHLAGLYRWLTETTGVIVANIKDLRALFLLILTEMGAALVPVAMALADAKPQPSRRQTGPAGDRQPSDLSGDPPREEVQDVTVWLNHRTRRAAGAMAEAAVLYADYAQWMQTRGKVPVTKTRFGLMLSDDCGLAKRKAGQRWTINYLGVEIVPAAPSGSRGLGLFAIAGGRAA